MKRIALFLVLGCLLFAAVAYGQNTIKFLGIPVDGTKTAMISALRAKGYTYDSVNDVLKGEFNGTKVLICVQTVNNRVWRLAVVDQSSIDEVNIKIRFNRLLHQFLNNGKYIMYGGEELTDKDDISYEMIVNNKRYEALFCLNDKTVNGEVWFTIGQIGSQYRIAMFYENLDNAANGEDL